MNWSADAFRQPPRIPLSLDMESVKYENDTDYIINILIRELECQITDLKSELACMESYAKVHKKEVKKYLKKKKKMMVKVQIY